MNQLTQDTQPESSQAGIGTQVQLQSPDAERNSPYPMGTEVPPIAQPSPGEFPDPCRANPEPWGVQAGWEQVVLQALGAHLAQCRWKGQRERSGGQGPPGFPQRASLTNYGPG